MAYASLTTNLFTRLSKTFISCEPGKEWPHTGIKPNSTFSYEMV